MKKRIAVIISVLLALSFAWTTYAVEKTNMKFASGVVKAFDAKTGAITVKADRRPEFTCFIDARTMLRMSSGRKTADQIKIGDIAAIVYEEVQNKPVATSITVVTPQNSTSGEKKNTPANSQIKK